MQAAGKIPVDVRALDVDTLALSAHKFYGPKGVGVLYVKRGTRLKPWARGRVAGAQSPRGDGERGRHRRTRPRRRPGRATTWPRRRPRLEALRDRLEERLLAIPGARRNGDGPRVPNTANVSFEGIEAESLLMALDLAGIAVSTGAACAAGAVEPSHVLRGMGLPAERVQGSIRLSLGRSTSATADRSRRGRDRGRGREAALGQPPVRRPRVADRTCSSAWYERADERARLDVADTPATSANDLMLSNSSGV